MKRFTAFIRIIVFALALVIYTEGDGQVCGKKLAKEHTTDIKSLVGSWSGTITSAGKSYVLTVNIRQVDGQLVAEIRDEFAAPGSSLSGQISLCASSKYHFYGTLPDGQQFSYNPRLKDGVLAGGFQVGDVCRADKPTFSLARSQ
jgi:hypothetical protein